MPRHIYANTKTRHPLYNTWSGMRERCSNSRCPAYKHYGGRGIKVCARWDDFWLFVMDMGSRPEGMTLDRRDNDGDYEPSNCRWVTQRTQMNNRRMSRKYNKTLQDLEGLVGR